MPNTAFEEAYRAEVTRLAAYARANGISLLHLPWYGQDWAELNHGIEVRSAPGYSYASWLAGHKRLIDIGLAVAKAQGVSVEWPMSGYGPLVRAEAELTAHIVAVAGAGSNLAYVQANGLRPKGDWGSKKATVEEQMDQAVWSHPVSRGEQMIQPYDYDWSAVFAHLYANGATYVEVYVPSFDLANKAQLATEVARFAYRCGST